MVSLRGREGCPGESGDIDHKEEKPKLSRAATQRLLADGELFSMVSLNGPKDDPGDRGAKGDKGEPGQKGDKGEKGDKPSLEDVLDSQKFKELVTTPFYNDLSITNQYIENAFTHINNIFTTMASDRTYTITSSGYVSSRIAQTCPNISKDYAPKHVECNIPRAEPQIRLVTYSAYESLKSQVEMLTSKLAQLEARTSVTPITNTDLRQDFDDAYSFRISLYPKYGDWLLTSDSKEQNISFAGFKAEVGRSIYIQTRKRAYLYANGHSFYGLPGSSTSENQWLSNNTTYRFVRASSTSWCVTSSSSPYPWT